MNAYLLSAAIRRSKMTPPAPAAIRKVDIRVEAEDVTAIPVTNTKAEEVVFLSGDGTPTTSATPLRSTTLTVRLIQHVTSEHYGIDRVNMNSMRRTNDVVLPRQVAMHLANAVTSKSNSEIGRLFNRDVSTVWYAVEKVQRLIERDEAFAAEVLHIRNKIEEMTK